MKIYRKLLLSLLGCLGPELHQCEHKSITRESEDDTDGSISPAIVVFFEVEGSKVVATTRVLADVAVRSSLRVDEIGSVTHALQVVGKI
jgi:hypothetical protein